MFGAGCHLQPLSHKKKESASVYPRLIHCGFSFRSFSSIQAQFSTNRSEPPCQPPDEADTSNATFIVLLGGGQLVQIFEVGVGSRLHIEIPVLRKDIVTNCK